MKIEKKKTKKKRKKKKKKKKTKQDQSYNQNEQKVLFGKGGTTSATPKSQIPAEKLEFQKMRSLMARKSTFFGDMRISN